MTARSEAHELFDRMISTVATWSEVRRQRAGFDLCVGGTEELQAHRRRHARSILAATTMLDDLAQASSRPMVLMKGLEVAQLYPSPSYRPFRDVDVLLDDPNLIWGDLAAQGFRSSHKRRADIDHHHLPALVPPGGTVGLELHHRPNVPRWSGISAALVLETAQPTRTDVDRLLRPRDDLHALLMAMHCWKGGFVRLRDLFDALLLAAVSDVPVAQTARELGLSRFWSWTLRIADAELFERSTPTTRAVARVLVPEHGTHAQRTRSRLLGPYLVKGPIRVTRSHVADYRLGRSARERPSVTEDRTGVNREVVGRHGG